MMFNVNVPSCEVIRSGITCDDSRGTISSGRIVMESKVKFPADLMGVMKSAPSFGERVADTVVPLAHPVPSFFIDALK